MTDISNPGSADNQSEELFTVAEAAKKTENFHCDAEPRSRPQRDSLLSVRREPRVNIVASYSRITCCAANKTEVPHNA